VVQAIVFSFSKVVSQSSVGPCPVDLFDSVTDLIRRVLELLSQLLGIAIGSQLVNHQTAKFPELRWSRLLHDRHFLLKRYIVLHTGSSPARVSVILTRATIAGDVILEETQTRGFWLDIGHQIGGQLFPSNNLLGCPWLVVLP